LLISSIIQLPGITYLPLRGRPDGGIVTAGDVGIAPSRGVRRRRGVGKGTFFAVSIADVRLCYSTMNVVLQTVGDICISTLFVQ
jgi:hypothetical protein